MQRAGKAPPQFQAHQQAASSHASAAALPDSPEARSEAHTTSPLKRDRSMQFKRGSALGKLEESATPVLVSKEERDFLRTTLIDLGG